MSRLTVRADEVRVGDIIDPHPDNPEGLKVVARVGATESTIAFGVVFDGDSRERIRFRRDEEVFIERPDPPTDEEHEALLRRLVAEGGTSSQPTRDSAAAVLRLLDAERARYANSFDADLDAGIFRGEVS